MENKVKEIIADHMGLDVADIISISTFVDLGMDSLDEIEIVMAIETEYGIAIPDEDAENIKTVGQLVSYIKHAKAGLNKDKRRGDEEI